MFLAALCRINVERPVDGRGKSGAAMAIGDVISQAG